MPDLHDYEASQADLKMTENGRSAMLMFLTNEGWVGVALGRSDLVTLQDRIRVALSQPVPPDPRH